MSLWHELNSIRASTGLSWCVVGDFNSVISLDKIAGGREHWTLEMQEFKDCVTNVGLGHINTVGHLFTWTNKRLVDPVHKRLDRMLANKK